MFAVKCCSECEHLEYEISQWIHKFRILYSYGHAKTFLYR